MAPERLRAWTISVSLASLPFIVPHVFEDFAEGMAQRIGLSTGVGAFLLGGYLALQFLGLLLLARGKRAGFSVTFWVGLIWVVGALVDHGPQLLVGHFRTGPASVLWVVGLIVAQATSSFLAWWGYRSQKA